MPRIAVGIIAPPWLPVPPPSYGGTETFLDTLARGLKAAGHEVILFATGDSTCDVPRRFYFPTALGVGVGGAVHETRHVIEAYRVLSGVDVIHDNTLVGPLYARSLFGGPAVVTTTHGPFDENLGPVFETVNEKVPVVTISQHQAGTARGWRPAAVIHHGLDLERFPVGRGSGGYAFFLGRMNPDKGVHVAAEAARRASVPLRIAAKMSEPFEHEYFASSVAPLLGGGVEYVGEVGFAEKVALLQEATCLLNPIQWAEPFGLVMTEALACGTPVVASARGSAHEIVEHGKTGYLCTSKASLVDSVVKAAGLERAACRRAAEDRFSAARMVEQYLGVYQRAMMGQIDRRPETAA